MAPKKLGKTVGTTWTIYAVVPGRDMPKLNLSCAGFYKTKAEAMKDSSSAGGDVLVELKVKKLGTFKFALVE